MGRLRRPRSSDGRNGWIARALIALLLALSGVPAGAADPIIHTAHAIAMYGEPKYGPDFTHFEYVNPDAPKGGELRLGAAGTFDSFNPYIIKGNPAAGAGAETLTVASEDEPFTRYGLIAETITWPEDRSWVSFTLRPEARWHDGTPITVDDVIFSLETLKTKGQPFYRFYYASIDHAQQVGERTVKFVFKEAGNRELPLIAGEMPILPKHYWEGRDFERSTLEPPLSSGPYRVAEYEAGRYVILERVPDYWGEHLAVNVGQNNFARMRYDYFRDETVLRQALKAGVLDFRIENQAKAWALDYDTPAVRKGWLRKELFPHTRPAGLQALAFNTRRPVFADAKVREALGYAFDFEWTNRVLFFDQYKRSSSYFSNSEMASSGLPEGEELRILDAYRGRVPDAVFTQPFTVPTTDGSGWPRENLLKALALLREAGWVVRDQHLVNAATGEPMRFEILIVSPTFERIILPFVRNLKRLGIEASIRLVDESQYINRLRAFDFDMAMLVWGESDSPGNEQRSFWGSAAAEQPGSRNYIGVHDPVIDGLIEGVIGASDRASLIAHTRALDRVLLWNFYVIPAWHLSADRVLFWDKFSFPAVSPEHGVQIDTWWYDAEKAARLKAAMTGASEG
ncbi:MAG: ABC transporter substrate-binding protein [Rhodospirillales bacterium]|nr:ABC transporter substrate-binding protein [Rhodospirillales bacterium]